jgi:hypothetical protein
MEKKNNLVKKRELTMYQNEIESGIYTNIDKFRELVELLIEEHNIEGKIAKGYAIYLEYPTFSNDREEALNLLIEGYSKTKSPALANTIGYIYYYGVKDKPDYVNAKKYFMIGADGGQIESLYKLADILLLGLTGEKDETQAVDIYFRIYNFTFKKSFLSGDYQGKFADLSIRVGNCYMNGYVVKKDENLALLFYMQAKLALEKRIEVINYIGDESIYKKTLNNINMLRNKLGYKENEKKDIIVVTKPTELELFNLNPNLSFKFNALALSSSEKQISLIFNFDKHNKNNFKFLTTFPKYNYISLLDEIKLVLDVNFDLGIKTKKLLGVVENVIIDYTNNYISGIYDSNPIFSFRFINLSFQIRRTNLK